MTFPLHLVLHAITYPCQARFCFCIEVGCSRTLTPQKYAVFLIAADYFLDTFNTVC